MDTSLEREIKLRPGPAFEGIELPGESLPPQSLLSVYYDTEDLRLAQGGITLRRREGEGDPAWQLKLGHGRDRTELRWPAPDPVVPDEVRTLLLAHSRGKPLSAVATLATTRTGVRVHLDGHDAAEVVADRVDVVEDDRVVASFDEIEIESVDGDLEELRKLEGWLRAAGATDPDGRPKVFQALGVTVAPDRKRKRSGRACVRDGLREQFRELMEHDPGSRLGVDPEDVHKQRVAVRRLRAQLRAARPLLDRQWADELRTSLKPVGQALGQVRDLDVLLARIEEQAADLAEPERSGATDVLDRLRADRQAAQTELVQRLSEPWYLALLNRLERAVDEPAFEGSGSLARRVRKEHRRMERLVGDLPKVPSDRQLHALRIAGKRVRYAAELASACGTPHLKPAIKRAKELQDVLGHHQDAVVAEQRLRELGSELHRPAAQFAIAALLERQEAAKASARAAAPRAWRRLHKQLP